MDYPADLLESIKADAPRDISLVIFALGGQKRITRGLAIKIAESDIWKSWSDTDVVGFQLYEKLLCMKFDRFHEAVTKVLGRSVRTHEFAKPDLLQREYEGRRAKPTMDDILALIPKDKQVWIV